MKAKIAAESNANNSGILLTIGMIVKNEEKILEQCLQGLQPLRDAIPCQLIICDTGSTDNTIEIAQKYADKVQHFTWCNDFAAARNSTLQDAKGAWYMFLDADEIFDESILEIAEFFRSKKYLQYDSATHKIRNYGDFQHTNYNDFFAHRLGKITPNFRFEGKIHEHFNQAGKVYCIENAVSHHDGYIIMHVGALKNRKAIRNRLPMLKEVETHPTVRGYRLLADCYSLELLPEWEDKEKALKRGVQLETEGVEGMYGGSIDLLMALSYKTMGKIKEYNDCLRSWFTRPHPEMMADCEMHYMAGIQALEYHQYETAIQQLESFLRIYRQQKEHHDIKGAGMIIYNNATQQGEDGAYAAIALACAELGQVEKAKEMMRKARPAESMGQNGKPQLLLVFAQYLYYVNDDELLRQVYHKLQTDMPKETQNLLYALQNVYKAPLQAYKDKLQLMLEEGTEENPVTAFIKIILQKKPLDLGKEINVILQDEDAVKNVAFAEIISFGLEQPALADKIFSKISASYSFSFIQKAKANDLQFSRKALHYLKNCEKQAELSVVAWRLTLMELVLNTNNDYTEDEWMTVLEWYAETGEHYGTAIYREELWCEEQAHLLPGRYGYLCHLSCGLKKKRQGDLSGYVRSLNQGLKCYEDMKNTSEYLKQQVEKKLEKERQQEKKEQYEMEKLKKKVKENIVFLIEQDKKAEAAQLFRQYKQLAPEDTENARLETMLLE